MKKWTSRKFWLSIVAALCAIFLMITGNLEPEIGVKIVLAASAAFIGAEGLVDFGRALFKHKTGG